MHSRGIHDDSRRSLSSRTHRTLFLIRSLPTFYRALVRPTRRRHVRTSPDSALWPANVLFVLRRIVPRDVVSSSAPLHDYDKSSSSVELMEYTCVSVNLSPVRLTLKYALKILLVSRYLRRERKGKIFPFQTPASSSRSPWWMTAKARKLTLQIFAKIGWNKRICS